MNSRQRHILHVLASILVGSMAFFIALFLTFFAEIILLSQLQLDFILPIQLIILFAIACIAGMIFAIFVARKYYRDFGKRID